MKSVVISIALLLSALTLAADLFVVNSESQTLSRLDETSWTIHNAFASLGQYPYASPNRMACGEHEAWVVITYENTLQGIPLDDDGRRVTIFLQDSAAPYDVALHGDLAYVSGSTQNKVYRVDPNAGVVTGELTVGVYPEGLLIANGMLFVCNSGFRLDTYTWGPGTVTVIDLGTFTAVDTLETGLNPQSAAVVNDELHVVCTGDYSSVSGCVSIFGLSDLAPLATLQTGGSPGRITAHGNTVYLGNSWPAGLYVYDAPSRMVQYTPSNAPFSGGSDVHVYGDRLATLDALDYVQNSVLRVYDLADNSLLGSVGAGVGAVDVKDWTEEQSAEEETGPHSLVELAVWPNPARGACSLKLSLNEAGEGQVVLYNLRGQRLRSLATVNGLASWDGRDERGAVCASGVYLARYTDGRRSAARKFTLLR